MIQPGVYRHYKGGRYLVLMVADHHDHDGKKDVVYVSLTTGKPHTRPLTRDSRQEDSWTDKVKWPDGYLRNRFVQDDEQPIDFFKNMFQEKNT